MTNLCDRLPATRATQRLVSARDRSRSTSAAGPGGLHEDLDRAALGAEARVDPLLVDDHSLEVLPDPLVVGAAVLAAGGRAVLVDGAAVRGVVEAVAVAVRALAVEVRAPELPLDRAGLDLRDGQREAEAAADRLAERDPRLAVDRVGGDRRGFAVASDRDAQRQLLPGAGDRLARGLHGVDEVFGGDDVEADEQVGEAVDDRLDLVRARGLLGERGVDEETAVLDLALELAERRGVRQVSHRPSVQTPPGSRA